MFLQARGPSYGRLPCRLAASRCARVDSRSDVVWADGPAQLQGGLTCGACRVCSRPTVVDTRCAATRQVVDHTCAHARQVVALRGFMMGLTDKRCTKRRCSRKNCKKAHEDREVIPAVMLAIQEVERSASPPVAVAAAPMTSSPQTHTPSILPCAAGSTAPVPTSRTHPPQLTPPPCRAQAG